MLVETCERNIRKFWSAMAIFIGWKVTSKVYTNNMKISHPDGWDIFMVAGESNQFKCRCPADICCHQFKNWRLHISFLLIASRKDANRFPSAYKYLYRVEKCRLQAAIFLWWSRGKNRKDGTSTHTGATKCPVNTWLVRGRFHVCPDAFIRMWTDRHFKIGLKHDIPAMKWVWEQFP